MYKKIIFIILTFWLAIAALAEPIKISHEEALEIGVKIWYNECGGTVSGLTSWSYGENFASLGIGHFIWYPYNENQTFSESFPALLHYMEQHGIAVPQWLQGNWSPYCPWNNRLEFLTAENSARMIELREFLLSTIPIQTQFMISRMEMALPRMLASMPPTERPYIRDQFYRIAATPVGVYALVDYVNFKGIGVSLNDYYDPQGWGLAQVIEEMKYAPGDMTTMQAFTWAANQVLTRRVVNALPRHDYTIWLDGWRNRLRTYLE